MNAMYLQAVKLYSKNPIQNSIRHISRTAVLNTTDKTVTFTPDGWDTAKPYSSLPGPKPLPLIGNAWRFIPFIGEFSKFSLGDLVYKLNQKYGSIFCLGSIPAMDMVFVTDPHDIETVFRNEGPYPIRELASKTVGYYRNTLRFDVFQGLGGMLTANGADWQDIRTKVNPILMRPQTVLQYIDGIDLITKELVTKIKHLATLNPNNEMPDDFMNTMYSWALENAVYIAVDKRLGCLKSNLDNNSEPLQIIKHVLLSFKLYEQLEFQPSLLNIYKTKKWKRFVEVADFLTDTFLKYVKEAEAKMIETTDAPMSILQQLLKVDRRVAIATTMDTLSAGVDTTGKQMTNTLYYIAKCQDAQDTLREELVKLLPHKNSPITKEVLVKASYLKATIKEAERLAPISRGNLRHTVKDMVLSGYQIPKGTNVITCHDIASKESDNYPRPSEFLPERWLRTTEGELSHKNTNPFVTLPFGFGPRSCVGRRIASLEMEIGIAKIIRNFHIMWPHKEPTFDGAPFVGIVDPLKFQFIEVEK